jgi:integrase
MLHSFRGVAFETRDMAEAILSHVEIEVAKGRTVDDVLSEFAPTAAAASGVEPLLRRWIEVFEKRVEVGGRAPRTLREYRRWAGPKESKYAHFAYWYGTSIWEIATADVEEWSHWLATERGLSPKTVRNVLAGFHSFLAWAARDVRPDYRVPRFAWPEVDEHQPAILSSEVQWKVLAAIPWLKAGVFFAMAQCLVRPSEARVLRVCDWSEDELRVARAAKDRRTGGVVRGLKSRNAKTLPCHEFPLRDWLEEFVTSERRIAEPDGPLFVNPDGRTGWWSETAMRRTWATACAKVGVRASLYEGTKHSSATALKALGADDRVLAALMGHRDSRSVEKYARLQGSAIRSELARLRRNALKGEGE